MPFIWTAWEFLYHQTAFSFGAIRLGYTQVEMLWLIQFADITGVDGVKFWLVLVNIAVFVFLDKQFADENKKIKFADFINAKVVLPLILFVLPLAYSAFIFLKPQIKEISVFAIQPNVSPLIEMTPKRAIDIFAKSMVMTSKAVKTEKPDLILWHESRRSISAFVGRGGERLSGKTNKKMGRAASDRNYRSQELRAG